jgi:hypothetical protein
MYHVYFVRERRGGSNLIKIGETGDCPYLRLDQLRRAKRKSNPYSRYELLGVIAIPDEEVTTGHIDKADVQHRFESLRDESDWFHPGQKLVRYIQEHARPHFCYRLCPDGPSIEEEMRALDEKAAEAILRARHLNAEREVY